MIVNRGRLFTIVLALGSALLTQAEEATLDCQARMAHLHANSPRPLAAAVMALQTSVTFEEVPLVYKGDLIDVTAPTYRPRNAQDRAYDPRGGELDATWPVGVCGAGIGDPSTALNALLKEYHRRGYPGEYRYIKIGSVFHIIPWHAPTKQARLGG